MMRNAILTVLFGSLLSSPSLSAAEPSAMSLSPQALQAAAKIRSTLKAADEVAAQKEKEILTQ